MKCLLEGVALNGGVKECLHDVKNRFSEMLHSPIAYSIHYTNKILVNVLIMFTQTLKTILFCLQALTLTG